MLWDRKQGSKPFGSIGFHEFHFVTRNSFTKQNKCFEYEVEDIKTKTESDDTPISHTAYLTQCQTEQSRLWNRE